MHVRTLPAPSSTLAAPQRAVGSRKANGALCPRCWLRWVSLRVLLGKPPTPAPCPAPTSHNFSSQTPGKDGGLSKGLGWSKEVVAGWGRGVAWRGRGVGWAWGGHGVGRRRGHTGWPLE